MNIVKKIFKALLVTLLVIVLLLVAYACVVYYNASQNFKKFDNYCPSSLVNTQWQCQEENLRLYTREKGLNSYGEAEIGDTIKPFKITFIYNLKEFNVYSIDAETGESDYEFGGTAEFADGICTLSYDGEWDKNYFFGEKTGRVTLTFVKLPDDGG